jgi:hypothetical protein
MKTTSENALASLIQTSLTPMKNKARLSTMTAFSFGNHFKHLKMYRHCHLKKGIMRVFFLRFTYQNETSKSSMTPPPKTPLVTMQWQPLHKGGIVLCRLLVAV